MYVKLLAWNSAANKRQFIQVEMKALNLTETNNILHRVFYAMYFIGILYMHPTGETPMQHYFAARSSVHFSNHDYFQVFFVRKI